MTRLSMEEQETIITWDRAGENADVFTYDPSLIKRLHDLEARVPDEVVLNGSSDGSVTFRIPKKYITIKLPQKRNLSEDQRREIGKRLTDSRTKKSSI